MTSVVVSTFNTAVYACGGGHLWVYLQYVEGLRRLGCEVHWLEVEGSCGHAIDDGVAVSFARRLKGFGLEHRFILVSDGPERAYFGLARDRAERVFRGADLLLNFHYRLDPRAVGEFRRTALVDIDPGLLQHWIAHRQISVAPHDLYFTTGETVGEPGGLIPDCGLPWLHIRPPVCLEHWPYVRDGGSSAFTTVSNWWGNEWVSDERTIYENNKRFSLREFVELPRHVSQPLELALPLTETTTDFEERRTLEACGWRVRRSQEVAATPQDYRRYIQGSRGEFSCAKPSCMRLQNAWISDRTLCYLASGRPAVVQNTGPSRLLPNGEGLFRFDTLDEAAAALDAVDSDYGRHRRAARQIAEELFDAKAVCRQILEDASAQRSSRLEAAGKW